MTEADNDFEKELWDAAANERDSAVSGNNYKNYILPLVSVKHLRERYEVVHEELKERLNDPVSNYFITDKEEIRYVLEALDEIRFGNTIKFPEMASYLYLEEIGERDDNKVKVDDAFDVIQKLLTSYIPKLVNILTRIFVRSELFPKLTSGIINLVSHPKVSQKKYPESNILNCIYKYYIGRFAMAEGSGEGHHHFLMDDNKFQDQVLRGEIHFSNRFSIEVEMTQNRKINRDGNVIITIGSK